MVSVVAARQSEDRPTRQVLDSQQKDVLAYPFPQVLFSELGESSLDFRLLFWTESIGEWLRIQSEVTFKAFDKLKENGIEIPFPQRELHLKSSDE